MSKLWTINNKLVLTGDNTLLGESSGASGATYEAGQYVSIVGDVISVTGVQPEGDYATNTDLQIVSAAIPDVSTFASETDLQSVSADILSVSAEIGDVETLLANL